MNAIRVSLIGLLMASAAWAQTVADNMVLLVPGLQAVGDTSLSIGCYTWDPVNEVFLTATFGSSREFRRIDMKTNPPTVTILAYTSDSTSFALSSDVPGGVTSWDNTGNLNPSGMVLNTSPITVNGVYYPPFTLAFLADNGQTVYEGGSSIRREWSKRFYRWDMREIGAPTDRQPDYDNAQSGDRYGSVIGSHGYADWNDVFSVLTTEQNILDALLPLVPNGTTTFNIGRQPALSKDSKYLYYNDSADDFGGIWRIATETGVVEFIYNDRDQADRINCEPAVVHTSVRDLDPNNPAEGDQILFEGDGSLNEGGINYLIDTGNEILGPYVLLTERQIQQWIEWNGNTRTRSYTYNNADPVPADTAMDAVGSMAVRAMWADEEGNIYFNDGSSYNGLWRYDWEGRLGLVRSHQQHVAFNLATTNAVGNTGTLRLQTRTIQYSGPAGEFPVTQVMFMAVPQKGVGAANAFKPGDFNRDNVVDEADVEEFLQVMATPIRALEQYTLGSSSWNCDVVLESGANTIEVRSIDRAGNVSNVAAVNVNCSVDTTSPTVTINNPTAGQTIATRWVNVSGTASDAGTPTYGLRQVEVQVNSGEWVRATGTTSWSVTVGLSLGANTIRVRALDNSDNYSEIVTRNVNCTAPADAVAPTVGITGPSNGASVTSWAPVVSGWAADSGSGVELVEVRVNSGPWQKANGTTSWSLGVRLYSGTSTIEVRSKDYAGNYSSLSSITVSYAGTADTAIPSVAITSPVEGQGFVVGPVTVTGTASDPSTTGSGLERVEVRVNDGPWQLASGIAPTGTSNWTCDVTVGVGLNTIEARSRDYAGNYSESKFVVVTGYEEDTTSPTVSIDAPFEGETISNYSFTVKGSAVDPGSVPSGVALVEVRLNGGNWIAATGRTSWTCPLSLVEGENVIEARCQDYAGNFSTEVAVRHVTCSGLVPDETIPTVTISSPTANSLVRTFVVRVSGTANDADVTRSGVGAVEVRVNDGPWQPAVVSTASNTVRYSDTAVDEEGNALDQLADKTAWHTYLRYDMNGNGLVTGKDKLLLWRHLGYAPVDYDRDGDVDMDDFAHFQACWTGANVRQTVWACGDAQLDPDSDVDLDDLEVFMNCARGPGIPADPACMD